MNNKNDPDNSDMNPICKNTAMSIVIALVFIAFIMKLYDFVFVSDNLTYEEQQKYYDMKSKHILVFSVFTCILSGYLRSKNVSPTGTTGIIIGSVIFIIYNTFANWDTYPKITQVSILGACLGILIYASSLFGR